MRNVLEKVWMTTAKRTYQKDGLPVDDACISIRKETDMLIGVQASGII